MTHVHQVQLLAILCGLPGLLSTLILLWAGGFPAKVYFTVITLAGACWLGFTVALLSRIIRPLQTASNMLSAMREGDFSLHASYTHEEDPLGQVMLEINQLNDILRAHKLDALEALNLLNKVVSEIDVAVFTFDPEGRLGLVNREGERLLGRSAKEAVGKPAHELGLNECLVSDNDACLLDGPFPNRPGRYTMRRGSFREGGRPHTLLLLTDVSQPLREEERQAWKKLIRVIGHELNNSFAPIKSLSASMIKLVHSPNPLPDLREDLTEGLQVIHDRAEGLNKFLAEYSRLAKLPPPCKQPTQLAPLIERAAMLQQDRLRFTVVGGPECELLADPHQLEQVCINLFKNAIEAAISTGGGVSVRWEQQDGEVKIIIDDEGPGIANPDNLFIPFFSTKPGGSGIGLTLSRQIIEAHGGHLDLVNRTDVPHGARATVVLPG
ncbi:MAG: ATP-binding protein [Verrucomicrobiota bacterium]|nr:ATP-binding protein [Verrucomicrobiota bacterium]